MSDYLQALTKIKRLLTEPYEHRSLNEKRGFWAVNIVALLIWGLGIGLVSLYFASAAVNHGFALFASYFHSPKLMLLNILPCVLLVFFFYLLTNRVWGGMFFSGLIVVVGTLVDYYKITLRNDPLIAADVTLVSEAANMTGEFSLRFSPAVILSLIAVIAVPIFAKLFLTARIKKPVGRIAPLIILCGLLAALIGTVYFDDTLYNKTENIERNNWFLSRWSDRDQYISRGFIYPFVHSIKTAVETPPDGYSEKEAAAILAEYEDDIIPEGKAVNIIAIMLEAYNDFSAFDTIEFDEDPYSYLHALQAEAISGNLVTNIFAGGTIDTERSFVTGYPYMSQYRTDLPTYASYLRDNGYTTEGGHPGYDWFYNRLNVNKYFGFDNYYFFENRYEVTGDVLMRDNEFFNDIVTLYKQNKKTDKPYFNFSVTYQNHGPYADYQLYEGQPSYIVNKGYSESAYHIFNNYLDGIKATDRAIEYLIESMRKEDEPVVVVLFGDHNPWLGDNSWVYSELGIDIDRGSEQGFYNYYNTPYVIWANDAAKAVTGGDFEGDGGDFSPCFLMNRLFEECGYGGPAYMKAANTLKALVPVVNRSGIYVTDESGLTNTLEGEALERYSRLKKLEYYMKHDY